MTDSKTEITEPLWMPAGSVRSIIALGVTFSTVAAVFTLPAEAYGALLGLSGFVMKAYFDARSAENSDRT